MGLAALGTVWQTEMQREREHELLFIGEQFGLALWRYYEASPDAKAYPRRLEDLLEDRRHAVPRRHLRQIFVDPLTGRRDWVVIMSGGQITAVRSRSQGEPIVRAGFRLAGKSLPAPQRMPNGYSRRLRRVPERWHPMPPLYPQPTRLQWRYRNRQLAAVPGSATGCPARSITAGSFGNGSRGSIMRSGFSGWRSNRLL